MEPLHHSNQDHLTSQASLEPNAPVFDAVSREKHQKLFKRGINWLGVGVLLMGLSFVINVLFHQTDMPLTTMMYIMTSVGSVCIMKGLVDILGF